MTRAGGGRVASPRSGTGLNARFSSIWTKAFPFNRRLDLQVGGTAALGTAPPGRRLGGPAPGLAPPRARGRRARASHALVSPEPCRWL